MITLKWMNSKKKAWSGFFGRTPRNLFRVSVLFQATWLLIKNASRQIDSEVLRYQEKKRKKGESRYIRAVTIKWFYVDSFRSSLESERSVESWTMSKVRFFYRCVIPRFNDEMNGQRRLASSFAVQTALSPDSAAFAADELVSSDIMAGNSPLAQLGLCWTERSWALRRGVGGGGAAAAASTLLLAETAACWLRLTDKTALVVDARLSRRSAGPIQTQGYPYSTKILNNSRIRNR